MHGQHIQMEPPIINEEFFLYCLHVRFYRIFRFQPLYNPRGTPLLLLEEHTFCQLNSVAFRVKQILLWMYIIHGHCHSIHGESVVFVTYWTSHSHNYGKQVYYAHCIGLIDFKSQVSQSHLPVIKQVACIGLPRKKR